MEVTLVSLHFMKTVSVVMCTYNGAKYLREQLDSIISQTYPIHELIIQDDCSTDETIDIIKKYATKNAFIKLFINEHNLGFNQNFKSACMKAIGDYVAISDQDDVWFPQKIETLVNAIGSHDICFSTHLRGKDIDNSIKVSPQYSLEALLFAGFAGHTTLANRTLIQTQTNWIDGIIYDWALEINAQLQNGIVMVDEPLNWHRMHEKSACTVINKKLFPSQKKLRKYQPYLYGMRNYYRLHRKPKWKMLYSYIIENADPSLHQPAYNMCKHMLSNNPFSLLLLCFYCLRFRKTIYPSKSLHGFSGLMRSFFIRLSFPITMVIMNSIPVILRLIPTE